MFLKGFLSVDWFDTIVSIPVINLLLLIFVKILNHIINSFLVINCLQSDGSSFCDSVIFVLDLFLFKVKKHDLVEKLFVLLLSEDASSDLVDSILHLYSHCAIEVFSHDVIDSALGIEFLRADQNLPCPYFHYQNDMFNDNNECEESSQSLEWLIVSSNICTETLLCIKANDLVIFWVIDA